MDVYIDRADLHRGEIVEGHAPALEPGQARLAVDAFALSANNVTYAAVGDGLGYWTFFPAPGGWGRVPVWGYADVVESTHDDVAVGTRLHGCLPMSDELVIRPGRVGASGLSDASPHRADTAAVYRHYQLVASGDDRDADAEARHMLLYGLFATAFLIDDTLDDGAAADRAETVVLSSASSKTAIGTAFQAHHRGVAVIGLTSPGNRAFVEGLGRYDRVFTYDEVDQLAAADGSSTGPIAYVDMAGNAEVTDRVHRALGDALVTSFLVGDTHWDDEAANGSDDAGEPGDAGEAEVRPGPEPEFFFAPTQATKRIEDWGPGGLAERTEEAFGRFADWADTWLTIERRVGADAALATFQELVANRADPSVGFIISMRDGS